jgi:hypothetical protein
VLILQVIGKQREEAVKALYIRHGLAPKSGGGEAEGKEEEEQEEEGQEEGQEGKGGMQEGELQAAMANWCAVLRVVCPLVYGQCYSHIHPAAPYIIAAFLQAVAANASFMALPADQRDFGDSKQKER